MPTLVKAGEPLAQRRRVYFDLRAIADGLTPANGEAGGQPQISTNGAAWTPAGIGTLTLVGRGRYYADLTQGAVANAGDHVETAYVSASVVDSPGDSVQVVGFDPTADIATIKGKTDTLGAVRVTATSPVADSGDVTVFKGDDYLAADGRAIDWADASSSWPDLSGASVVFALHGAFDDSFTASLSVPAPGVVRLQLTAAQTSSFVATAYPYEVVATLPDRHVQTLFRGTFFVTGE